jgi:exopolyphosphatase
VDHNKIRSDLDYLKDAVTEILDHHQDEGAHDNVIDDVRKVAFKGTSALVGSTCTLVTERLMETKVGLNKETDKLDAGLGIMLLGVILLDTMNMNKEAAKGTPRDGRAIDFLLQRTDWCALQLDDVIKLKIFADGDDSNFCSQAPSRSKLYEYLRDSKFDKSFWESMSPRDALRIDYKRFEPPTEGCDGFGLSSVLLSMEKLIAKDNFFQEAEKYMFEANVDLLGVLTMVIVDDIPQRELLLIGNTNKVEDMTEYLLKDTAAAHLKIVRGNMIESLLGKNLSVSYLKQGNPKGSRKQVAPLMMAFYQN